MKRGLNSGISNTIKREEYYNPQQSHNGQPQQQYNNRVFKNKKKGCETSTYNTLFTKKLW